MKRLILALLASALTTPAVAQHHGHHMPGHTMPAPKVKPAPKKQAAKKPAVKKPAPKKPAAKKAPARPAAKGKPRPADKPVRKTAPKPAAPAADPHAGHHMPAAEPTKPAAADPHAGHDMTQSADPHAGHQADAHAGHSLQPEEAPQPPLAPPPPGAFTGPAHAADAMFGVQQMAKAREDMRREHGEMTTSKVLVDQIEARIRNGRDGCQWDGQAWIGGDIDKAWLKTEGEGEFGGALESAEVQALWSHAIDPWFDLQAGVRYDIRPQPQRGYLVLGVQGLAPYWFEVDAAAFVSNKGDVSARIEAEYDLRLTQALILQPRVELDLAFQDVPELGIGAGLSTGELGARLRYEIRPEFAPYMGVEYERAFGDTADFRSAEGEKRGGWNFLVGVRTWF